MKNISKKICIIIYFLILISLTKLSFCQQNCYNTQNDIATSVGDYFDVQTESTKNLKFLKHLISVQITESNLNDSNYLSQLNLFLLSYNSQIMNNEIRPGGFLDIRLCDSMNSVNYFEIFRNSNLFITVTPVILTKEDTRPIHPTDPEYNNQWNFKQPNIGSINKDIEAKKVWTITKNQFF